MTLTGKQKEILDKFTTGVNVLFCPSTNNKKDRINLIVPGKKPEPINESQILALEKLGYLKKVPDSEKGKFQFIPTNEPKNLI